jgi:hypothetical protein
VPKQINTPSPGQALVRMFSLKGRFQPVLDEVIVPVVIVPLEAPATRKLAFWGTSQTATGAAQNLVILQNRVGSGVLIVITKIWAFSSQAADTFVVLPVAGQLSASGIGNHRDTREGFSQLPVMGIGTTTQATAVLGFPHYLVDVVHDVEFIMEPFTAFHVIQNTANKTFQLNFEWYEVALTGGSTL